MQVGADSGYEAVRLTGVRRAPNWLAAFGWVAVGTSFASVAMAAHQLRSVDLGSAIGKDQLSYERILGPSISAKLDQDQRGITQLGYHWRDHDVLLEIDAANRQVTSLTLFLSAPTWEKGGREEAAQLLGVTPGRLVRNGRTLDGFPAAKYAEWGAEPEGESITLYFR